jgi:hypothetical protein
MWGYIAGLRIGGETAYMVDAARVDFRGVVLSLEYRQIRSRTRSSSGLQVENFNQSAQTVDIGISTDINLDRRDDALCEAIPGGLGFLISPAANALRFIPAGYPLVRNVSTFWFA